MDAWLSKLKLSDKFTTKVLQMSLIQLCTSEHCKLQKFKKKPRLLKKQLWFGFILFLNPFVWEVVQCFLLSAHGSLSAAWLHISTLSLSAAPLFMLEPYGSLSPFCPFWGSVSCFLDSCSCFSLLLAAQERAATCMMPSIACSKCWPLGRRGLADSRRTGCLLQESPEERQEQLEQVSQHLVEMTKLPER